MNSMKTQIEQNSSWLASTQCERDTKESPVIIQRQFDSKNDSLYFFTHES
jgi:hypothetical protein